MIVVLDTNVLVSAFAARGLCADLFRDVISHHTLAISDYILDELQQKLTEKLRVPTPVVLSIHALLQPYRVVHAQLPDIDIDIRDLKDIPIVAFALAMKADYLITGDRDLLDIASSLPVPVISPREFYQQ
jgi:putative PIN family toxin of toxin-antitoxin system